MKHPTHLFTFLLLLTLLAACVPVETAPTPGEAAVDADADAAEATVEECDEGFRLFDHERLVGEPVCIPENPQRVLALDLSGAEFSLLNDIPIVGIFGYMSNEITALTPVLGEELAETPTLDWPPNLEFVTKLEPDLIIAFYDAGLELAGFDEIAPLVIYDPTSGGDWKASTAFWSEVFQKQDEFTEIMETYNARIAELQEALGEDRDNIEVSLFVPTVDKPLVWLVDSAPGQILEDVGLGRPASQVARTETGSSSSTNYGFINISSERLDLVDGDEIFIFTWASADLETAANNRQALEDFHADNELWQTLEGVQNGNVHIVGGHWFRAQTYLAANLILDDLFTYLTDIEPTIPSAAQPFLTTKVSEN